jgi:hypothetical protein
MAISTTTILGTDSISGTRKIINDNFSIIKDEINSIETYFDPSAGTITELAEVTTNNLTVGTSSAKLEITPSAFDITSDVEMTGNFTISGKILRNDIETVTLDETSSSTNIGNTTTPPAKTIYRVTNADSSAITFTLFDGAPGQELIFVCQATTNAVNFVADSSTSILLPSGNTTISLSDAGDTVHLLSITDESGNDVWVIIGGNSYTIS